MGRSSITGGEPAPTRPSGTDADLLGPSDSSDSGSDVQGEPGDPTTAGEWGAVITETGGDSDAAGTGERASATGDAGADGADILPDRVITPGVGAAQGTAGEVPGLAGDDDGEAEDAGIEGTGDDERA